MEKENITRKRATILSAILGVAVLGFLGYRYLAPFGKTVYYRFTSKLPEAEEITTFSPGENSVLKIPHQIIKTTQSKLSLKLVSKDIESIKAKLKFKEGPKEIKLGVRGNEKDSFLYQPLYHSLLQDLNWEKIKEEATLFQKIKKYDNLSSFAVDPPIEAVVATYFYDPANLLVFQSREKPKENLIINAMLRGTHVFYVKVVHQPFKLAVEKVDQNAYEGKDEYKIIISYSQNVIAEKTIPDDGITDNSKLRAEPQREEIIIPDAELGVYKIEVSFIGDNSDSIISKIETNQEKLVAVNNLFLVGEGPTSLWTNAKILSIGTPHAGFEQTIKLDDEYKLDIEKFNIRYNFDLDHPEGKKNIRSIHKLESPKNDLGFSAGNALFAFSEEAFFDPEIIKSIDLSKLDNLENIDYILTTCSQAKTEDDWLVAETSFDPKDIKIDGDKLYFSLESPELAKYGGELEIDYLEIAVKSKGILEKEEVEEEIEAIEELEVEKEKNFFQRAWQSVFNFFDRIGTSLVNSIFKIFKREAKPSEEEEPITSPAPSPPSSPSPSSSLSPSPTPAAEKISILVKILNGGAGKGEAGKFAKKLEENGFSNTKADNADKFDYKNALIQYRKENEEEVDKIVNLLKEDYETIDKKEIATTSAEIVVIIGEK